MKTDGDIPFRVLESFDYQKSTIDKTINEIETECATIEIPITSDYNFIYSTITKELIGYRKV